MPLQRTITLRYAVVFVIANIIGSGVYRKVAPMTAELNSPLLVLLCFLAGGIITLFGALCVAELGAMMPEAGGEFRYHSRIYNRFFAFTYGWASYTVIKTGTIASLAYVFAQSLHQIIAGPELLPSLADINVFGVFYPFQSLNVKLTAMSLILLLTLFNTMGIKIGVRLSATILALVLSGIALIVIAGIASPVTSFNRLISESDAAFSFSPFLTAMLSAFFAYEGWNSIAFVGGEVKNPQRNIPASLAIGVFAVIAIYLIVDAAYLSILSTNELHDIFVSQNKIAAVEAMRKLWGDGGALAIAILIVVTTFGCLHSSIVSNSRIYYAMANQGLFFRKASNLNSRSTPAASLWMQGGWSMLLVMSGTFDQLTDMLIFAAFIFYGAMALGVIILRVREPQESRPYKVWGYPVVPAVFVLFSVALVFNSIITRPREAGIGLTLIALGVPFYFYFNRKK
ncbi:MAG: amino acid permease [Chitinophagaceae bacterium]|nr:amino acid permease [Chitinophagaceae bacterium]